MALNIVSSERLSTNVKTSNLGTELIKKVGQSKNLIINGAMQVAQRGTSSTSNGYKTIDRITPYTDNIGVTSTYSQVDVTSGGAYDAGFRKAWQVTKGAGTTNTNSQVNMGYKIEAQDIANSGWKYTDPNSYITISFWLKTSVSNHNPQLLLIDADQGSGTKNYFVDIPVLTADTWTKITHSIPGHANQVYNNDNGNGLEFQIIPWYGTDYTDAGNTPNAWGPFGTKPVNSTWLTTNNSTFQVTGLQLETGSVATDFEHECYQKQLYRCYRYYVERGFESLLGSKSGAVGYPRTNYPVVMRAVASTVIKYDGTDGAMRNQNDGSKTTGFSTYNHYDYGFASRGSNGSPDIIYSSTYYADAEL